MATTLRASQNSEPFRRLLSPVKVVQDVIEERTENKVSLLEGRASVVLYLDNPSFSNGVDISSANNFMALGESYFIMKLWYAVKDNRNAPNTSNYKLWITPTKPGFSWVKNICVELNGQEVTQSSLVSGMQPVEHILFLMEDSIGKMQYADTDLYELQKLDPKLLKVLPLQT